MLDFVSAHSLTFLALSLSQVLPAKGFSILSETELKAVIERSGTDSSAAQPAA